MVSNRLDDWAVLVVVAVGVRVMVGCPISARWATQLGHGRAGDGP